MGPFRSFCVCVFLLVSQCVFAIQSDAGRQEAEEATRAVKGLPQTVRFSGALRAADGSAQTGTAMVTFALYGEALGGSPLWIETQNVVLDEQGRYTVLLGSTTREGLPRAMFAVGEARWLGIRAAVEGAEEQTRIQLVSVPYALASGDAQSLGGRPATDFQLTRAAAASGQGTSTETSAAPGGGGISASSVITEGGTVGALARWTDTSTLGNSSIVDTGAFIGIGTASPGALLDVNGMLHIGARLQQTSGFERFILGQNSIIGGGSDANMVEFRITHALPSGSPSTGLLYQFRQNDDSGANLYGFSMKQTKTSGEDSTFLTFETNSGPGGGVERVRIDKNGNVGVNTTAPNAKLEVVSG